MHIKEHPTLAGYGASEDGRVWSRRTNAGSLATEWLREIKLSTNTGGYLHFSPGRGKTYLVARFVLEVFVGPCPEDHETRHLDGDRRNNAISNLAWSPHLTNIRDKHTHGTMLNGERHGMAKLTEDDVQAIRVDPRSNTAIASDYGVNRSLVRQIKARKIWRHLEETHAQ